MNLGGGGTVQSVIPRIDCFCFVSVMYVFIGEVLEL